jgi:mono/diheme cytochrome c family protein
MSNKGIIYIGISLIAIAAAYAFIYLSGAINTIDANNPQMVARGQQIYGLYCAECHGTRLEGETTHWRSTKADGTLPAPPHDETGHTWHHNDQLLFDYTQKGGAAMVPDGFKSGMPAFGKILSDAEIRSVLAFIKSKWPREIQQRQQRLNEPR